MKEESLLWMMHHHLDSAITLMNIAIKHELLDLEVVADYIGNMSRDADSIWEEQMWKKYSEALYYTDYHTDNIYQFTPESRGPDT